ncbi:hypothetical protein THIX_10434 [Thiomonas sp. X19]|nr:hypothetical protein THIX_10434 [Thiomonas sp. X19]
MLVKAASAAKATATAQRQTNPKQPPYVLDPQLQDFSGRRSSWQLYRGRQGSRPDPGRGRIADASA